MNYLAIDLGNVVGHVNFNKFFDKLSSSLNISLEDAKYFLNRVQKLHDLGLTNLNDELVDHFNIKSEVTRKEILDLWNNAFVFDKHIIKFLAELKKECDLEIALLSNIGHEHVELVKNDWFLKDCIHFFSCDVGVRKPNYLYYQSFLQMHPQFRGCLYVDDLKENLENGSKFGFQTFNFLLHEHYENKGYNADICREVSLKHAFKKEVKRLILKEEKVVLDIDLKTLKSLGFKDE